MPIMKEGTLDRQSIGAQPRSPNCNCMAKVDMLPSHKVAFSSRNLAIGIDLAGAPQ